MDRVEDMVRLAMEEIQRNGVPVINRLLAEARTSAPAVCNFYEGCESCQ